MRYGAKGAKWAKMTAVGDSSTRPTYDTAETIIGVNEIADTINQASASAYGDNMEKIYISEFTNGEISVKAVDITPAQYAKILGTETDGNGGLIYGGEDNPPFGAYGFIRNMMDSSKTKYYEAVFYPKVQGTVEAGTSKTKEESITLEYDSVKFRMQSCSYKNAYMITKRFATETEASEYLDGLFDGTSNWPESES